MGIFSSSLCHDIIAIFAILVTALFVYGKLKFTYWSNVGLPTLPLTFPFGNGKNMTAGKCGYGQLFQNFYTRFKANGFKHGGVYIFFTPMYIPTDPEIIKHIMQKDFQHFVNHGVYIDEENDPLSGHLFNLEDEKWRNMRVKLTPTFTSGKMKMMFHTLADCAVGLKDIMDKAAIHHIPVDIKDVLARFTTDIIGSVAFGLECNSLKNPEADFRKYGRQIFKYDRWNKLKWSIMQLLPKSVLHALNFKRTKSDVEQFFMKVIRDTVDYREKNNIFRKDFLHMLIQLKNRGTVTDDDKIFDDKNKTTEKALTLNELAAQAFVFFFAGFETSSTTMTFALLELATHPNLQEKLREEITSVLAKSDGQLTYAAVMEMPYMEKVINETLRKYPPLPLIVRQCTKDYTIPNTSIHLKKGVKVGISSLGLQNDPDYFPEPDKFDPERFSEKNKKERPDFTWIPFGEGPRLCIGQRFGMLQSRVGLITMLKNYKIGLNNRTKLPICMDKSSSVSSVEGGVWLDVEKLDL